MAKLQLLDRIEKLSVLVHSDDLKEYKLADDSIKEIRVALDKLTEEYISTYC